jgi:hypothetical protein
VTLLIEVATRGFIGQRAPAADSKLTTAALHLRRRRVITIAQSHVYRAMVMTRAFVKIGSAGGLSRAMETSWHCIG